MRLHFTRHGFSLAALLLVGCDTGDHIKDASVEDRLAREAGCVTAAERLNLYDEAQRHLAHANDEARHHFEVTGKPNDVQRYLVASRRLSATLSAGFAAQQLNTRCGGHVTVGQVQAAE
jgi:hypothetical protein